MDNQLLTLSKIFTERLFRIPDYQRGYAWTDKQLQDFWNDLEQLGIGHNHYIGVLTLEDVHPEIYNKWEDDLWIINSKNYQPYFVVDGQQRLTTSIILIQSILERINNNESLNYTDRKDIQKKFIFDSKDTGISRSYIFGYEKDNPSYEFLKTKIFLEKSTSNIGEETIYTQNLENAKQFFISRLKKMDINQLEKLYKKITQQLLFNIFTITEDVDVCVAFETMNNRGKPLSYLELLKNRLIYLSLKIQAEETERIHLRKSINDCWKTIYHSLGRNKSHPLDDDLFLRNHYIMYFGDEILSEIKDSDNDIFYSRRWYYSRIDYATNLLEKRFVSKRIYDEPGNNKKITINFIYDYVRSLQEAVDIWYKMFNPINSGLGKPIEDLLQKINRLEESRAAYPLILSFLHNEHSEEKRIYFLKAIERLIFISGLITWGGAYLLGESNLWEMAIKLHHNGTQSDKIIKEINDRTISLIKAPNILTTIIQQFKDRGFYKWPNLPYFLYEYEQYLQSKSKSEREKIIWDGFVESPKDYITIEHIYPQSPKSPYWRDKFSAYSSYPKKKKALRDSLGNLLALSKAKNSSLSNLPFPNKKGGRNGESGYYNGGFSENEVSKIADWTPEEILNRGLKMLKFMESQWGIDFQNDTYRKEMLGLAFLGSEKQK